MASVVYNILKQTNNDDIRLIIKCNQTVTNAILVIWQPFLVGFVPLNDNVDLFL